MKPSEQLCEQVAGISPVAICSFSMGKDSIGSAIQMSRYFENVEYVFLYMIPGLEFQEISLNYYENKFGKRIKRMPNPSLYYQLNGLMYQSPENVDIIKTNKWHVDYNTPRFYDTIFTAAKMDFKLPGDTFTGVGVRMADSLARRASIKQNNGLNLNRKQFFPIFDWNIERLYNEILQSGIKLPVDYKIWGRSFDGFDYRFLKPLKDNFPRDYEKVREYFPLVEMELKRYHDYGVQS
jgi:3'-phosphoadenosine 5'-phosphosulfate sulfotransferase (PAPS reductase)/FAD synthetase